MFLLKYDTVLLKWVSLGLYCKNFNHKEKEVFKIFEHLVWKMYWAVESGLIWLDIKKNKKIKKNYQNNLYGE